MFSHCLNLFQPRKQSTGLPFQEIQPRSPPSACLFSLISAVLHGSIRITVPEVMALKAKSFTVLSFQHTTEIGLLIRACNLRWKSKAGFSLWIVCSFESARLDYGPLARWHRENAYQWLFLVWFTAIKCCYSLSPQLLWELKKKHFTYCMFESNAQCMWKHLLIRDWRNSLSACYHTNLPTNPWLSRVWRTD